MVLFLVVSQALAGDPTPAGSDTSEAPGGADATPAPAEAPATPAPAPAPAPTPFDVTIVPPSRPLGGESTPPPPPPGAPPPPPKEAPPGVTPGVSPAPISALPGLSPPPPVAPPSPPVLVVEIAAPAAAPPPPPGVGLRITKGDSWRVKDAADLRYTTVQFARLVNDRETLVALDNAREFGKIGSTTLAITGGGLLVASLVVVTSNIGQPNINDYSVNPELYEEEADYDAAEEFARGQYDKSIGEWQSQRLGSTLFLVGTGAVVLAGAPFVGRDNDKREQRPELVYTRERAQGWVDSYNQAHPPAAPAEPASPPPGGQPDIDVEPDDAMRLELRPLLGVGFVGLSGSF